MSFAILYYLDIFLNATIFHYEFSNRTIRGGVHSNNNRYCISDIKSEFPYSTHLNYTLSVLTGLPMLFVINLLSP